MVPRVVLFPDSVQKDEMHTHYLISDIFLLGVAIAFISRSPQRASKRQKVGRPSMSPKATKLLATGIWTDGFVMVILVEIFVIAWWEILIGWFGLNLILIAILVSRQRRSRLIR